MTLDEFNARIEKYSNATTKESIGGTQKKQFVRINDDKAIKQNLNNSRTAKKVEDSVLFRELFESLMTGKSSYKTYLNEMFVGDNGQPFKDVEVYVPSYVSVLQKDVEDNKWLYTEVIGSRLGNLMGIDTVFNTIIHLTNCGDSLYRSRLLSVDYVPRGYETISLYEMGIDECGELTPLVTFLDKLRKAFPSLAKKHGIKITPARMQEFLDAFSEQYLFKCCMCSDTDFDTNNVDILYNRTTGNFRLAPLFDMEGIFGMVCSDLKPNLEQKYLMSSTIKYLVENNPKLLKDFMNRANKMALSSDLKRVMLGCSKDIKSNLQIRDWYKIIKNNIDLMNEQYRFHMINHREKEYKPYSCMTI